MTDTNLSDLVYSTGLTDWHIDAYDGPPPWWPGGRDPTPLSDDSLQFTERLIADLPFEWSRSPSSAKR
jgi:hypothetical protein